MSATTDSAAPTRPGRLHSGRRASGLTKPQVTANQRERMLLAMADAVTEKGYARVSVQDVLTRAGVSRTTFYEQFTNKQDCFLAAFDLAVETMLASVVQQVPDRPGPAAFDRLLDTFLSILTENVSLAHVFLVDVYAAGPEAFERRTASQQRIAARVAKLYGVRTARGRFACEALVAAIATLVTARLAAGDIEGLRALRRPLAELAHDLMAPHLAGRKG